VELRVAAYAVVIGDDEAMLLAHWNDGPGRTAWTLPGGGLDPGEHPADAAVREVREETGYEVELDELIGVDSIVIPADQRPTADGPVQALRIVYRAHVVGGELTAEADGSTDEAAWFSPREVDDLERVELVDTARRFAGWEPPDA
jgi:ADP-ribose pyrophosphatase YjhB (NUDIX family)